MATKAACDVITSSVDEDEITQFIPLFKDLIEIIPEFVQNEDYEVLLRILGLFDDITASSDETIYTPYLIDILRICCGVRFVYEPNL